MTLVYAICYCYLKFVALTFNMSGRFNNASVLIKFHLIELFPVK